MEHLVIATNNKNKKRELEELLKDLKIEVLTLSDLDMHLPHVIEDGRTFRQNAVKKAITFSRYIKEMILADDSGLVVDALGGKPGVRSSRFAHTKATDGENNSKLLALMKHVPAKERQANFVCVLAIAKNGTLLGVSKGECSGTIGFEAKGENGFGYDPVFTPNGYNLTFAQLKPSFKNRISHRGQALRKARSIIEKYIE
ncbi:MAG: non-canonical purine NTP pyrophosphatase, RdgB/HAM1 family [Omnitrophica bacterium RBG_13_46_9]|nr:MAG: non-canonical purine NTP pyrophosphatase, RdgB/HAM1 family [Omnitrophica bacterium RBG_13_46_9]